MSRQIGTVVNVNTVAVFYSIIRNPLEFCFSTVLRIQVQVEGPRH